MKEGGEEEPDSFGKGKEGAGIEPSRVKLLSYLLKLSRRILY